MIFLWRSRFYNSVSAKNRLQDTNLYQLQLKLNDVLQKDLKITTNFET